MTIREINLVDSELLFRCYALRHLILWTGCFVVSLLLISGVYFFQSHVLSTGRNNHKPLKPITTDLKVKIEETKRLQGKFTRLEKKKNIVNNITDRQPFYRILVKLSDIMNKNTWIERLSFNAGKGGVSTGYLKLNGFSSSNQDLGEFINRLSDNSGFKNVVLNFSKESERKMRIKKNMNPAMHQVQFQINCDITKD